MAPNGEAEREASVSQDLDWDLGEVPNFCALRPWLSHRLALLGFQA